MCPNPDERLTALSAQTHKGLQRQEEYFRWNTLRKLSESICHNLFRRSGICALTNSQKIEIRVRLGLGLRGAISTQISRTVAHKGWGMIGQIIGQSRADKRQDDGA